MTDGGANEIVFKVSRRTRKVIIKYSVVYKNENGDAVYRENKEKLKQLMKLQQQR